MFQPSAIPNLLWLLCLAAAVTLPRRDRPAGPWVLLAGFGCGAGALAVLLVPAAGLGLLAGVIALWQLLRPSTGALPNLLAGVLAGCGATLHAGLGAPLPVAVVLAALPLGIAWGCQRDAAFAPADLRRPTLLFVGLTAPLVAAVPGLQAGWHSALALNQDLAPGTTAMPGWVWPLVLAAPAIGILRGLMVRR